MQSTSLDMQVFAAWACGIVVGLPCILSLAAVILRVVCWMYNLVFGQLLKQELVPVPDWSKALTIVFLRGIAVFLIFYGFQFGLVWVVQAGYLNPGDTNSYFYASPLVLLALVLFVSASIIAIVLPTSLTLGVIVTGGEIAVSIALGVVTIGIVTIAGFLFSLFR